MAPEAALLELRDARDVPHSLGAASEGCCLGSGSVEEKHRGCLADQGEHGGHAAGGDEEGGRGVRPVPPEVLDAEDADYDAHGAHGVGQDVEEDRPHVVVLVLAAVVAVAVAAVVAAPEPVAVPVPVLVRLLAAQQPYDVDHQPQDAHDEEPLCRQARGLHHPLHALQRYLQRHKHLPEVAGERSGARRSLPGEDEKGEGGGGGGGAHQEDSVCKPGQGLYAAVSEGIDAVCRQSGHVGGV